MASVHTDEVSRSRIARRLSVLPATVGLVGICLVPLGASVMGLTEASRGWALTGLVASFVLATVLSGASFGLYLGLATLAVAGLVVGGPPSAAELTVLSATGFAVHETVRFSLDARRPSRFGPGLISGYLSRSALTGLVIVVVTITAWWLAERPPQPSVWLPIGLAVAGLPLLAGRGAELLDRTLDRRPGSPAPENGAPVDPRSGDRASAMVGVNRSGRADHPALRVSLAVLLTASVVSLTSIAARARGAIESTPRSGGRVPLTTAAPPTTTAEILAPGSTDPRRDLVLIVAVILVLVFGVLYLALRRPEALFELDELDADLDETTFGIAFPGQAEQDDEVVEVDDQDLARLLAGLRLDIAGERDPGRAIRFGYANIERTLADFGLTRGDSETEQEFLARALPRLGSAGTSMTSLTRLFERARFGHEPMDESMRQAALSAVTDLLDRIAPPTGPSPAADPDPMATPDPVPEPDPEPDPATDTDGRHRRGRGAHS